MRLSQRVATDAANWAWVNCKLGPEEAEADGRECCDREKGIGWCRDSGIEAVDLLGVMDGVIGSSSSSIILAGCVE